MFDRRLNCNNSYCMYYHCYVPLWFRKAACLEPLKFTLELKEMALVLFLPNASAWKITGLNTFECCQF